VLERVGRDRKRRGAEVYRPVDEVFPVPRSTKDVLVVATSTLLQARSEITSYVLCMAHRPTAVLLVRERRPCLGDTGSDGYQHTHPKQGLLPGSVILMIHSYITTALVD